MTNNFELNERTSDDESAVDLKIAQQELRDLYEEQQRRLCCPTCGEDPFID